MTPDTFIIAGVAVLPFAWYSLVSAAMGSTGSGEESAQL